MFKTGKNARAEVGAPTIELKSGRDLEWPRKDHPLEERMRKSAHIKSVIFFLGAVGIWSLVGCGNSPRVVAHLCGDVNIPGDIDAVRLSLQDETDQEMASGVVQLFKPEQEGIPLGQENTETDGGPGEVLCPKGEVQELPVDFELYNGAGTVWVIAQGLRDQVEVMRSIVRAQFPISGPEHVYLGLQSSCLGAFCAYGQTCVDGKCEVAIFNGDENICPGGTGPTRPVTDADCQQGEIGGEQ
jgi:hypothetical protein